MTIKLWVEVTAMLPASCWSSDKLFNTPGLQSLACEMSMEKSEAHR